MGIWEDDKKLLKNTSKSKKDSIDTVRSAYRSMLHPVAYVSMAITTGKLYYEVLESKNVKTIDELVKKDPDSLYRDIIQPNIKHGVNLAERIAQITHLPVIAPAIFEAKKQRWHDNEYMFMWYRLLEEKVEELYLTDGWEYSNGASQEFVRAMEMQFGFVNPHNGMAFFPKYDSFKEEKKELEKHFSPVFKSLKKADRKYVKEIQRIDRDPSVKPEDRANLYTKASLRFREEFGKGNGRQQLENYSKALESLHEKHGLIREHKRMKNVKAYNEARKELRLDEGTFMITNAIKDLRRRGFACDTLFTSVNKLVSIGAYFYDYLTPRDEIPPYEYDFKKMDELFKELREF